MLKPFKAIVISIISIIASYYISILLHEYSHATCAWLFGYKDSPFDILYGNWILMPVSEHVDYQAIFASGHGIKGAIIGVAGISMTILLFLISYCCLTRRKIINKPCLFLFFYWLGAINLCEIFTYIIARTFSDGDVSEFAQGLAISPVWILFIGGLFACLAVYCFFRYALVKLYLILGEERYFLKRLFLYLSFWPILLLPLYWSAPTQYKPLAYAANVFTALLIIIVFIVCDPRRSWVNYSNNSLL